MNGRYDGISSVLAIALVAAATLIAASTAQAQVLFAPPVHYPAGGEPHDVQAADLDRDGWLDLAVVDHVGSVSVLLNQGDGTFAAADLLVAGNLSRAGATARFNADPYPDLVVSNSGSNDVSVFFGRGDDDLVGLQSDHANRISLLDCQPDADGIVRASVHLNCSAG
jgi:hypothetical protein